MWMGLFNKILGSKVKEEKDSVVKDLLGIEETQPTKLMVEFWESPLHFSGYKLSKSKLFSFFLMYEFPKT